MVEALRLLVKGGVVLVVLVLIWHLLKALFGSLSELDASLKWLSRAALVVGGCCAIGAAAQLMMRSGVTSIPWGTGLRLYFPQNWIDMATNELWAEAMVVSTIVCIIGAVSCSTGIEA